MWQKKMQKFMFSLQSMWPELHSVPDSIVWHQQFLKKLRIQKVRGSVLSTSECVTEFRSGELK